jgi:hypothetical protein
MLISSETGGGEIVSSEDTKFYDDVACLAADWLALSAVEGQKRSPQARAFVRVGRQWLEAHDASYAQPDGMRTTMGSGVVAFVTMAEASSADRAGRALSFDEVIRLAGDTR